MDMATLKFKKLHPDAVVPKYATPGSACVDLVAIGIDGLSRDLTRQFQDRGYKDGSVEIPPGSSALFGTGLAFEIPAGHVLLVFGRSGHGFIHGVRLSNCVGVIDCDYRGEVQVKLRNDGVLPFKVSNGARIAQALLVPIPRMELLEAEQLSGTERGTGGFGSTGA